MTKLSFHPESSITQITYRRKREWSKERFIAYLNGSDSMGSDSISKEDNKEAEVHCTECTTIKDPTNVKLHHLSFAVTTLELSLAWYYTILGAHHISSLDRFKADGARCAAVCIAEKLSGLSLELRLNPVEADYVKRWEPVTSG